MNYSNSIEKLIAQIKAIALPQPELVQLDEEKLQKLPSRRDLFEQLIDSDSDQSTASNALVARRSSMRAESPLSKSTAMDIEEDQSPGCKCSKIDCLKLYCQCFAKGKKCGKNCICVCCGNHKGNQAGIYHAKKVANFRNPGHFPGVPAYVPGRKCTCKKSSCRKNYCECFRAGVPCGLQCECTDCHNGKPHSHDSGMGDFGMQIEINQIQVTTMA